MDVLDNNGRTPLDIAEVNQSALDTEQLNTTALEYMKARILMGIITWFLAQAKKVYL